MRKICVFAYPRGRFFYVFLLVHPRDGCSLLLFPYPSRKICVFAYPRGRSFYVFAYPQTGSFVCSRTPWVFFFCLLTPWFFLFGARLAHDCSLLSLAYAPYLPRLFSTFLVVIVRYFRSLTSMDIRFSAFAYIPNT